MYPPGLLLEGTLLGGTPLEDALLDGPLLEGTILEAGRARGSPKVDPNLATVWGSRENPDIERPIFWWRIGPSRSRLGVRLLEMDGPVLVMAWALAARGSIEPDAPGTKCISGACFWYSAKFSQTNVSSICGCIPGFLRFWGL